MKYKVGDKLIAKNTHYMVDVSTQFRRMNGMNSDQYFLIKNRVYIIDRIEEGRSKVFFIKSESSDEHGISFSVIDEYFYTIKEIRKKKLKRIANEI